MQFYKTVLNNKTNWLVRLTCIFWLFAKILCYKLWLSADRLFPIVPPANFIVAPSFIHASLLILSIVGLLLLIATPSNKLLQVVLVAVEITSCLFDQNRWQPWEYQFILTLLIILFNAKNEKKVFAVFGFLLCCTYFYSGLSKLNPVFIQSIWYKLLLSKTFGVSYTTAHHLVVYYSGYLLGLIEISLAIGLCFKQTKHLAALLLIAMHFLIIAVFGPIGLNYDHIIWSWNVVMILYLFLFIVKDKDFEINFSVLKNGGNLLIAILFGVLPIASLWGKWDYFLSASFFSSRPPDMYICIKKNIPNPLSKYGDTTILPCDTNACLINVRLWAFDELMIPVYPETRVYWKIKKQLENKYPTLNATYFIYSYQYGKKIKEEMR